MKKLNDDDIQKLVTEGGTPQQMESLSAQDKTDLEVYQLLFDVLEKEPEQGPSYYFSKKVSMALQAEIKPRSSSKFYVTIGLIFTLSIAAAFGTLVLIDKNYQTEFVAMVISRKWIILFGIAGFFTIQYADQKMLMSKLPVDRR
jgi:hypothetical protein